MNRSTQNASEAPTESASEPTEDLSLPRRSLLKAIGVAGAVGAISSPALAESDRESGSESFEVVETTISDVHDAMEAGDLTAKGLVELYLDRIGAYDEEINAFVTLNPNVQERAKELDDHCSESGFVGPLHGIPLLIKDNYDTGDIQTTAGAEAFDGTTPPDDAFAVDKLREAGAIVLGKTNLPDFARGVDGLSSVDGQTRNPYNLDYIPGGSSSGTGAGVASNLGLAGTATETGVSIRNPATNNCLVGIAPTRGLVSRDGIVPISFTQDRGGPHARTVTDAATLLDAMAGYDPADPRSARSVGKIPDSYTNSLTEDSLSEARIGVVRELFGEEQAEETITELINEAIDDMENAGATVIDPVPVQEVLDERLPVLDPAYPNDDTGLVRVLSDARTNDYEMAAAMEDYLDTRESSFPYQTLEDIVETGEVRPDILETLAEDTELGLDDPVYQERLLRINALQATFRQVMAVENLDTLVYPMKTQPARPIDGDYQDGTVAASGNIPSSITGFPAVVVPAGFVDTGLPASVEFLGRPFAEPTILGIAYGYEQATMNRQPPEDFGAL